VEAVVQAEQAQGLMVVLAFNLALTEQLDFIQAVVLAELIQAQ
jgi:hypothetical protein